MYPETLRKYPPVSTLLRIATRGYKLPEGEQINTGTKVLFSVLGLQRDAEYFPNPDEFDPERFTNKANIKPFTYLPFGEGPRMCIGKVILRSLVLSIKVDNLFGRERRLLILNRHFHMVT